MTENMRKNIKMRIRLTIHEEKKRQKKKEVEEEEEMGKF